VQCLASKQLVIYLSIKDLTGVKMQLYNN